MLLIPEGEEKERMVGTHPGLVDRLLVEVHQPVNGSLSDLQADRQIKEGQLNTTTNIGGVWTYILN